MYQCRQDHAEALHLPLRVDRRSSTGPGTLSPYHPRSGGTDNLSGGRWYATATLCQVQVTSTQSLTLSKVCILRGSNREGVQSNFWIHVSQTREGFNPPLRRGSNSNQAIRGLVCMHMCPPLSDWRWILVCLTVWVADLTPHLYGWHESKNWNVIPDFLSTMACNCHPDF